MNSLSKQHKYYLLSHVSQIAICAWFRVNKEPDTFETETLPKPIKVKRRKYKGFRK